MIELLLAADRHLAAGDVASAERIYRQVAEADPRNAMAVVGLARVAQAHGDDYGASALATEALGLDPDDDAARRLLEALSPPRSSGDAPVGRSLLARIRAFVGLG